MWYISVQIGVAVCMREKKKRKKEKGCHTRSFSDPAKLYGAGSHHLKGSTLIGRREPC